MELVFGEVRNIRGFRIGDACLYDCFEVELINLDILLFEPARSQSGEDQ